MLSVNYGLKASYSAIASKDNDALYFCTDTLELYKGGNAYSKAVKFVAAVPDGTTTPISENVVYALPSGELQVYNPQKTGGAGWETIGVPKTTTVRAAASATDDVIPTELATRTAIDDAIDALDIETYAPLNSPALTGTPTAPTAAEGTNTTQIATTAFVKTACDAIAAELSSAFEFKGIVADMAALEAITGQKAGDVYQVTNAGGTPPKSNVEFVWVDGDPTGSWQELGAVIDLSAYATLASPVFTGNPTAPTPTAGDDSTSIATTAFVADAIDALDIETYAPLNSPAFTGVPTAPTASAGTSNTQIATTAYADAAAAAAEAAAKAASDPAGSAAAAQTAAESYTDGKLAWVAF